MESRTGSQFPLTKKWTRLISTISHQNSVPVIESIQEAMILEWEISTKILEGLHKENYFKKCLKRKLYGLKSNNWNNCKVDVYHKQESGGDFDNDAYIDTIIQARPFDVIYFEELLVHIFYILKELDIEAHNIFKLRLDTGKRWKCIKDERYKEYPHNRFYNKVKIIKKTVVKEFKNRGVSQGQYGSPNRTKYKLPQGTPLPMPSQPVRVIAIKEIK